MTTNQTPSTSKFQCLCPYPRRTASGSITHPALRNNAVRSEAAGLVWRTWTPPRHLFRVAGGNCSTVRFDGIPCIADGMAHIADRAGVGVDLRAELRQVTADRPSRAANGEDDGDDDGNVRCPCRRSVSGRGVAHRCAQTKLVRASQRRRRQLWRHRGRSPDRNTSELLARRWHFSDPIKPAFNALKPLPDALKLRPDVV